MELSTIIQAVKSDVAFPQKLSRIFDEVTLDNTCAENTRARGLDLVVNNATPSNTTNRGTHANANGRNTTTDTTNKSEI